VLQRSDIDHVLETMLGAASGVSDLFLTPGRPLQVESSGELTPVRTQPDLGLLTPFQTEAFALGLLAGDRRNLQLLAETGSCDCAYEIPGRVRFRVNIFQQQRRYSVVMRKLEGRIRSIEELGLPEVFRTMAAEKNGLILVTGSTGSGKSTTLAAMLDEMNRTRAIHVLTLEDPIEFVHPVKQATFNQRELGTDFDTFASGLRAALRQAPKVILVGEMRDRETVEIALDAASTGHLVVSTLHSIDCGQTISRIVGMFDKDEESQVRGRLAESLRYVVNQRLLLKRGGGRVAALEIMGMNLRLRELVLKGESKDKTFYDVIGLNQNLGWQNYDQCIVELYQRGLVSQETALANASRRAVLSRAIDRVKQERGGRLTGVIELTMDSKAEECQRLLDTYWPRPESRFPVQIDLHNDGNILVHHPDDGVSPGNGGTVALRIVVNERRRLAGILRTDPSEETGQLVLSGHLEQKGASMVCLSDFRVARVTVAGQDRTEVYRAVLEAGLPLDLELLTPAALEFTAAKAEALRRVAAIGMHLDIARLRQIAEASRYDEERAMVEQVIAAIEAR
jgi:twitching motility protein PilT